MKSILDSIDEGFIMIDRDYRITSANRAFMEYPGRPLEILPANIVLRYLITVLPHVMKQEKCAL